jgi:hypothetical protein
MAHQNPLYLHEAIVVALINQPTRTASFEEIANFIEQRGLFQERKGNISLAKQVMLRSTLSKGKYKHLFEEIGAGYIKLRDSYSDFPLQLYSALHEILEPFKDFFEPPTKKISVVDPEWGENRKLSLNPKNVICIFSDGSGRKKTIYSFDVEDDKKVIKKYSKQENLEKLVQEIDSLSQYLVVVSKDAAVNVEHFTLYSSKTLKTSVCDPASKEWPRFKFSDSKKAKEYLQNFKLVKRHHTDLTLLQKKILDYKKGFGL